MSELRNVGASVRQRLLNRAKESGRPFDELLQYYAMERFLYRLSQSEHRDAFILKGALMLSVWKAAEARATRDIDLEGRTANRLEEIIAAVRDVCSEPVEDDGIEFDGTSVQAERITEDADYEGVRVTFRATLDRARAPMQLDIAFGDAITPEAQPIDYPTLLSMPAPKLKGYPRETVVAEKFEAMVQLGEINTRMKDFYDLWLLATRFNFEGPALAAAVKATFDRRKTELSQSPVAFSPEFSKAKAAQWKAFLAKSRIENGPAQLAEAIEVIRSFLEPVAAALLRGEAFKTHWEAPGPWS